MSNIKRVEWIDEAKALAIILVGVGHYSCPEGLLTWIYTFHMPLFFILSGITSNFEKYPFKEFFLKKVRTLLFPWVIAVVINVVFQNLCMLIGLSANKIYINEIPARILINWRLEQGGVFDPIYWFLPCLFMTQLILYFILKIFKTRNIQVFLLILLVVIAYIYEYLFDWILPWEIDLLPMSCFYVMFGFLIKRYLFHKINKLGTISGAIVGGVILVLGSNLGFVHKNIIGYIPDMNSTRYGLIILNITAAILCSVGIILLCRVIHSELMNYIGQNSLLFYLAQPLVYKITDLMLCIVLPFYSYAGNSFNLILLHVGTNVAILIYVYLYKKLKETSKMKVKRLRESIL